ncbi:MAG: hypothetical protein QM784_33260 [Polyangiaceae bacterium]
MRRDTWVKVVCCALALGGILWWLSSRGRPDDVQPTAVAQVDRAVTAERSEEPVFHASAPTPRSPRAPARAPVIDSIALEKTEVCYGEENLVTVSAHTLDQSDDELHFNIGGHSGRAVPLVLFPQDEGSPEHRTVTVFGRDNVEITVPVPSYRVKDCGPRPLVVIEYRARANRPDEFDFLARTVGPTALPTFEYFDWDFGDGQAERTSHPRAVHSFRARPQTSAYSQFLVRVTAVEKSRERQVGRVALQLLNRAYQTRKQRGVVVIEADYEPRFPVRDSRGVVRQSVRLFHHEDTSVSVDRLYVEKQFVGTASSTKLDERPIESVLPSSTIPPGDGLRFELELDTEAEPDTFGLNYVVTGRAGALAARGGFSLLRPPAAPTRESHVPVYERAFKARIIHARKVLGREYVTDEDLEDLERRGAFRDPEFTETPEEGARTAPPPGYVPQPRDGKPTTSEQGGRI